ncbi:MAG: chemotaxis protein CheW, partial [Hyphomicrobiaceae bacterium]|nr:chemotaxis protein CheW [Hyphomicrobiaceae bacterium]
VGMDVVRTNIELIGGTIDMKSVWGKGTTFMIKIPLTLAIVSTLIVESAGERFAIPQLAVMELVRAQKGSEHRIESIKDTPVLRLRNKLLPLTNLSQLLQMGDAPAAGEIGEEGFIVVMQVGNKNFGLVVDGVFHTEEIVVKPMSTVLRDLTMFSGNTILGDGSVIMIIDPNGIANAIGTGGVGEEDEEKGAHDARAFAESETTSLLIFRAGTHEPKAVPLSLVTRLEEIGVDKIERANGRDLVQYRGRLMPLVKVDGEAPLKSEGTQPMLVFADEHRSMGLVVDEIVDIVEERLDIEVASVKPGILGSAVIKGRATEIVDVGHFLPLAFEDWFLAKEKTTISQTMRVLLVDDSAFFRNMLAPVLKSAGYEVRVAASAEEAMQRLEAGETYDAIVSDIEMPGQNGYEFTEALRRKPETRHMPVIALSAHASPQAIARGRQAGFTDYVAKFDRPGLIAALKEQGAQMEEAA